MELSQIFIQAV